MCGNTDHEKCMRCQRYSINEHHGYRNKPSEDIVLCVNGGVKKWQYKDHKYQYVCEV